MLRNLLLYCRDSLGWNRARRAADRPSQETLPMNSFRCAVASLALMAAFLAHADAYPERPVRIVIPYAAGGGVDGAARAVAQHLSSTLKQTFFVEAKPGGGTVIGTDLVARSP